jgi:flagellar biosynthesis/type III secretory pathway chaperone
VGQRGPAASLQDQIIGCLRAEIQEHGVLLSVFTDQQKAIMQRESDRVMIFVEGVQRQVDLVNRIRSRREALTAQMVPRSRITRVTPLSELAKRFPPPMQPLLQALVEELLRIAEQVRRKANQNQVLLARSIEVIRDLLEELTPANPARTYENDGRVKISLSGTAAAYKT